MSTTMAALSSPSIRYAEFVQLQTPTYTDNLTNAASDVTVNGITFDGMGSYLGVTTIQQDMKATSTDVKLSISGIVPENISIVLGANIKGSPLTIWRGFLDSDNQILTIDGVQQFFLRYQGIVNNIAINETFDSNKRERSATCVISSSSMRLVLDARVANLKTNPSSWRAVYPNDTSMDRVPIIASTYFSFGVTPTTGSQSKVIGSTQQNPAPIVHFG